MIENFKKGVTYARKGNTLEDMCSNFEQIALPQISLQSICSAIGGVESTVRGVVGGLNLPDVRSILSGSNK